MELFVQKYRWDKDYTLKELSRRSGVAASHIHNIENEFAVPTIGIL